ncbi:MAG: DNA-binding protein [Candidatus Woesearchaeota archaeon]
MNIHKLFRDTKYLEGQIQFFKKKKHIEEIQENNHLTKAHLNKSRHNMAFFKHNKHTEQFNDWLIVILYYSLYHSALALITNKKYKSRNHHATILILIQEYNIKQQDIELINELSINKEDAELYTTLKADRHDASYSTQAKFTPDAIDTYEKQVMTFINKAEAILEQY